MTNLNLKVVVTGENNSTFGVNGHHVELSTSKRTISAFVSTGNFVSTDNGVFLHGLFKNPPYTSDFVKLAEKAVQKAFSNWNKKDGTLCVTL